MSLSVQPQVDPTAQARLQHLAQQRRDAVSAVEAGFLSQLEPTSAAPEEVEIALRHLSTLQFSEGVLPLGALASAAPLPEEVPPVVAPGFFSSLIFSAPQQPDPTAAGFYDRLSKHWDRHLLPHDAFPTRFITNAEQLQGLQWVGTQQAASQQDALNNAQALIARETVEGVELTDSQKAVHAAITETPVAQPAAVTSLELNTLNLGVVPRFILQFGNVQSLSLNGNGLTWVPYLGNLERLVSLSLAGNMLTKAPLSDMLPRSLQNLDLSYNQIVVYQAPADRPDLAVTLEGNPLLCNVATSAVPFTHENLHLLPQTLEFFRTVIDRSVESPLAKLHFMLLDLPNEMLTQSVTGNAVQAFYALPEMDRAKVLAEIWKLSGSPVGDPHFGTKNVFNNVLLLMGAVHNALLANGGSIPFLPEVPYKEVMSAGEAAKRAFTSISQGYKALQDARKESKVKPEGAAYPDLQWLSQPVAMPTSSPASSSSTSSST